MSLPKNKHITSANTNTNTNTNANANTKAKEKKKRHTPVLGEIAHNVLCI